MIYVNGGAYAAVILDDQACVRQLQHGMSLLLLSGRICAQKT